MCDKEKLLHVRHSYHTHTSELPKAAQSRAFSKSDLNFSLPASSDTSRSSNYAYSEATKFSQKRNQQVYATIGEYYKKYEHDEVPVKDSDNNFEAYERPEKTSLTNTGLDSMERRIYKNVSQELQTDDGSLSSLESNIKFFKTTVEKIFENFYTSMRDFEQYKTRFHEIINKSKEGSVDDMEDFIKDMFEHIMSSDNSMTKIGGHSAEVIATELDRKEICANSCGDFALDPENNSGVVEAYKNQHYLTDSTLDGNSSNTKTRQSKIDERFNIFLLSGNPYLEIKMNGRTMLSEINVKEPTLLGITESAASADDFKKLTAKKLELETYIRKQHDYNIRNMSDRDIPVKVSFAKKNIHLNEDFARIHENNETSKSFLSKLCNILCRKIRKSSLV